MKKLFCLLLALMFTCSAAIAELSHEIPEMTDALIRSLNAGYQMDQYLNPGVSEMPDPVLVNVNFFPGGTPFFFTDEDTFWVVPTCGPSYAVDGTLTESALHDVHFILYVDDAWDDMIPFVGYALALRGGKDARDSGLEILESVREDVADTNAEEGAYYKTFDVCEDTKLKVIVSGTEAISPYSRVEIMLDFSAPWAYEYNTDPLFDAL